MNAKEGQAMQLEDYFEFEKFDSPYGPFERIRIKGHRIAIENVLDFYHQGICAENIQKLHYPSLTLEEVYATILYYLRNKEAVEAYNKRGHEVEAGYYKEYLERGPYWLRDDALKLREAREAARAKVSHE
jgi:uncharacterized protein (DUF433 family)